jgi:hypothetical protein
MSDANAKRWMQQWRNSARALAAVKRAELVALTDDDVRRAISWLLADTQSVYKDPQRQRFSGLVIQQRYFKKLHPRGGRKAQ